MKKFKQFQQGSFSSAGNVAVQTKSFNVVTTFKNFKVQKNTFLAWKNFFLTQNKNNKPGPAQVGAISKAQK